MENVRGQNQDPNKHPEKSQTTERGNRDALRQDQSKSRERNGKKDEHVSNPSTHPTQRQEGMEGRNDSDVIR